ncbi:hypothetical protein PPACK8108_LOCUS24008 [Phakopsora pachyrhizi]|uniref:Uncharacterized protein n=1 Tax=Phakopsora pachyrhizi TaxID=170000 RepID=A0AAV0BRP8_PHAPC|nr:hypothetical protein PPACK8108_LOCUS24008 [Phakopsora pachyrhizi]
MEDTGYAALEESDPEQAPGARRAPISRNPSRKDPLRIQAIRAAVQEGSLPASALENELRQDSSVDDDDENEGRKGSKYDETLKVQYHYTLFHMTFLLATIHAKLSGSCLYCTAWQASFFHCEFSCQPGYDTQGTLPA